MREINNYDTLEMQVIGQHNRALMIKSLLERELANGEEADIESLRIWENMLESAEMLRNIALRKLQKLACLEILATGYQNTSEETDKQLQERASFIINEHLQLSGVKI